MALLRAAAVSALLATSIRQGRATVVEACSSGRNHGMPAQDVAPCTASELGTSSGYSASSAALPEASHVPADASCSCGSEQILRRFSAADPAVGWAAYLLISPTRSSLAGAAPEGLISHLIDFHNGRLGPGEPAFAIAIEVSLGQARQRCCDRGKSQRSSKLGAATLLLPLPLASSMQVASGHVLPRCASLQQHCRTLLKLLVAVQSSLELWTA